MSEVKLSMNQRVILTVGMILTIILIAQPIQWAGTASAQTVPEATVGPAIAAAATRTPTPAPSPPPSGAPTLWIAVCAAFGLALVAAALLLRRKKKDQQ